MNLKQCTGTCNRLLPATPFWFYRDCSKHDGLSPRCKQCYGVQVARYKEPIPRTRVCSKCGGEYLIDCFAEYRTSGGNISRRHVCRYCIRANQRQWQKANKPRRRTERYLASSRIRERAYYEAHRGEINERRRKKRLAAALERIRSNHAE